MPSKLSVKWARKMKDHVNQFELCHKSQFKVLLLKNYQTKLSTPKMRVIWRYLTSLAFSQSSNDKGTFNILQNNFNYIGYIY